MFLSKIETQGFKTFAQKTTLSFLPRRSNGIFPLTAIVGPNGSGKSNLSDAIRWALGEQSLKLLRGKESTDIIFSGSDGKGRAGFAEVSLTFDNTDNSFPIDMSEVVVTRRLFRDGESEYLINNTKTRLADIQLMLAEANVGQRSYSVVGQGMIDAVLTSTPQERKAFFDDATGVRGFQIKRHQAMLKLKRTYENLAETELVMREIQPRLRLLQRQTKRLAERSEVEATLTEIQKSFYQNLWFELDDELQKAKIEFDKIDSKVLSRQKEMSILEKEVALMEKKEESSNGEDAGLTALHKQLRETEVRRRKARDEEFKIQKEMELSKVRIQSRWAPLPLLEIVKELLGIGTEQKKALQDLKKVKDLTELNKLIPIIDKLFSRSESLTGKLQRPAPEDMKPDPVLVKQLSGFQNEIKKIEEEVKKLDKAIETYAKEEKEKRTELFDIERRLRDEQRSLHGIESERNQVQISLARFEERRNNLDREIDHELKEKAAAIKLEKPKDSQKLSQAEQDKQRSEIDRLKYKLELIGGIDPEIVEEFKETEERFNFLETQVKDLRKAMSDTESVIDKLDESIHKQSEKAFKKINDEFQRYFKVLFGGGSCSLIKLTGEDTDEDGEHDEESAHESDVNPLLEKIEPDALKELERRVKMRRDRVVGIDINATPPGKKLKSLNLLSGGERALTSIALLAAIMATNPAPFVVLDEVDAALDEANTVRFASILEELRKKTQYIVVTHNRATMEKADVLYGVTMNDDGMSQVLSVKMEDIGESTARR